MITYSVSYTTFTNFIEQDGLTPIALELPDRVALGAINNEVGVTMQANLAVNLDCPEYQDYLTRLKPLCKVYL